MTDNIPSYTPLINSFITPLHTDLIFISFILSILSLTPNLPHYMPMTAQSLSKVSVDVRQLGVDMVTIVGHKFGCPKGVAALYMREGINTLF